MKYIVTICRIMLGMIFVVFGLNGFLHFIPAPQYPGVAGQFIEAIFTSHFYVVVFLTQIVGGLLLLANRYVPLGLLLLGPVIVNILNFHLSMLPRTIPLALLATALWLILFFRMRSAYSGLFAQKIPDQRLRSDGSSAAWEINEGGEGCGSRASKNTSGNRAA
jgi:putative oxidoreductase